MVVWRRGARGIDDRYTHCGDDTSVSSLVRNTPAARLKDALDRLLAASALVVFSPVLAADALWILLETGRPVLFAHPRVGKDGRIFRMYKFRTMVQNAVELNKQLKSRTTRTASSPTIRASRAAAGSSGARASTSCRSCSTSCAAR